jgi:hypothetical protein
MQTYQIVPQLVQSKSPVLCPSCQRYKSSFLIGENGARCEDCAAGRPREDRRTIAQQEAERDARQRVSDLAANYPVRDNVDFVTFTADVVCRGCGKLRRRFRKDTGHCLRCGSQKASA